MRMYKSFFAVLLDEYGHFNLLDILNSTSEEKLIFKRKMRDADCISQSIENDDWLNNDSLDNIHDYLWNFECRGKLEIVGMYELN